MPSIAFTLIEACTAWERHPWVPVESAFWDREWLTRRASVVWAWSRKCSPFTPEIGCLLSWLYSLLFFFFLSSLHHSSTAFPWFLGIPCCFVRDSSFQDWTGTHYTADSDPELLSFLPHLWMQFLVYTQCPIYAVKPRASCMLRIHCTNWATSPVLKLLKTKHSPLCIVPIHHHFSIHECLG